MVKDLTDQIMELYLLNPNLSTRVFGVMSRLKTGFNETDKELKELTDKDILFMQSGYYQLNLSFLWKDQEIIEKYRKRVID